MFDDGAGMHKYFLCSTVNSQEIQASGSYLPSKGGILNLSSEKHRHCCVPHIVDGHPCHGDYAIPDDEHHDHQVLNQQNTHPNCL
jgi:hypothetical protein